MAKSVPPRPDPAEIRARPCEPGLPSYADINPHDDGTDGLWAAHHFYGRSAEQLAEALRADAFGDWEDLMWMGPVAFQYYLVPVVEHFRERPALIQFEEIGGLLIALHYQVAAYDHASIHPLLQELTATILDNMDRYALDDRDRAEYRAKFESLHELWPQAAKIKPAKQAKWFAPRVGYPAD